jgi:hypothetical protein
MTETTTGAQGGTVARLAAWIGRCQRELSARIHRAGDERARRYGWEVKESTGRFGFGARTYRDPRFDDRRRQLSRGATQAADPGHSAAGCKDAEVRR